MQINICNVLSCVNSRVLSAVSEHQGQCHMWNHIEGITWNVFGTPLQWSFLLILKYLKPHEGIIL